MLHQLKEKLTNPWLRLVIYVLSFIIMAIMFIFIQKEATNPGYFGTGANAFFTDDARFVFVLCLLMWFLPAVLADPVD